MKALRAVCLAVGLLSIPAASMPQDFGVLESAETINQGNTKLLAAPFLRRHSVGFGFACYVR